MVDVTSAIFSPSLARQQLAIAKDWEFVDRWLLSKFKEKSTPCFERNADTLKILLNLASTNETADEEHGLLTEIESQALKELNMDEDDSRPPSIVALLESKLSTEGRVALDALADACAMLDETSGTPESVARQILDLQTASYELEQASDRAAILSQHLITEINRTRRILDELKDDVYQQPEDVSSLTSQGQRKIKLLQSKLPELRDRVAAASAIGGQVNITVNAVHENEEAYQAALLDVKDLEAQVRSFHGLPHDVDLARLELETLRVEMNDLIQQRDSLFEGLVERESPKKSRRR